MILDELVIYIFYYQVKSVPTHISMPLWHLMTIMTTIFLKMPLKYPIVSQQDLSSGLFIFRFPDTAQLFETKLTINQFILFVPDFRSVAKQKPLRN